MNRVPGLGWPQLTFIIDTNNGILEETKDFKKIKASS